MAKLEYESRPVPPRPVIVERLGMTTRVIVAMPLPYLPSKVTADKPDNSLELLWDACRLAVQWASGERPPPRAEFEVTPSMITVTLRDPGTGEVTSLKWSRASVRSIRCPAVATGLWIDVDGRPRDFLQDLSEPVLHELAEALTAALAVAH